MFVRTAHEHVESKDPLRVYSQRAAAGHSSRTLASVGEFPASAWWGCSVGDYARTSLREALAPLRMTAFKDDFEGVTTNHYPPSTNHYSWCKLDNLEIAATIIPDKNCMVATSF